jgi:hypothetical protein
LVDQLIEGSPGTVFPAAGMYCLTAPVPLFKYI